MRWHDAILEKTAGVRSEVTWSRIGPGATAGIGLTSRLTDLASRVGRHLDIAVIPADAVDREFARTAPRLDDTGAAYTGSAALVLDTGRHLILQPAGGCSLAGRIAEAPGSASRVTVTPGSTCARIAGSRWEVQVISAASIEPNLGMRRRREAALSTHDQNRRNKKSNHLRYGHSGSFL